MKNLKKALVEFKKEESAEAAMMYMDHKCFGKTKIKITMSKYKKIDLKRNNKSEASQNFNEVVIVSASMNRFKNSSSKIIAPTDTLIAVIEKDKGIQLLDILLAVQPYGKAIKTRSLDEQNENQNISLHQVLLKFQNTTLAMKVLAQAHSSEINGCLLNLTFAETSI